MSSRKSAPSAEARKATVVAIEPDESPVEAIREERYYDNRLREVRREYDGQVAELRVSHKKAIYRRESIVQDRYEHLVGDQRAAIAERVDPLKAQLRRVSEELLSEQIRAQRLHFQLLDSEKLVKDLEIDVVRARAGLPSESDESSAGNVQALRRTVERLRLNVLDQNAELAKAAAKKAELEATGHDLQSQLDLSQLARSKAETLVKDLERRLARKTEDLDAALSTRTSDRAAKENAVAELSRLQFTVSSKEDDVKSLNSSVEHSNSELRDTKAKFEAINAKLQTDLKKERGEVLDLEAKVRALTAQLDREKHKLESEQKARKEAQVAAKKAKDRAEEWEAKVEDLEGEVVRLEKTIRLFDSRLKL